jgi:phenylpropionate dioxygenase-like ring-hydroxylating dioxygenase large terminal subunit
MIRSPRQPPPNAPPDFLAAKTRRQKARSVGLDPNYWYAVEQSSQLATGQVIETKFWGRSIAVYRGSDGIVRALENRCAHRQLKLSDGQVEDCRLTCPYHGWSYDEAGVAQIPHETFGRSPKFKIPSVPVQEKYGLIFIFPGDPALSLTRDVPHIPELHGENPWPHVLVQMDCAGHHSMVIENVGDLTHGYLHRRHKPFDAPKLLELKSSPVDLRAEYDVTIGAGKLEAMFLNRPDAPCNRMKYHYDYPYHWSNTDDQVKHCLFTLPIDESHNRHIFLFYMSPNIARVPGLPLALPSWLVQFMLNVSKRFTMVPVLSQDVWVIEREQRAWEDHWTQPEPEVSPLIIAVQELLIRRWDEYLRSTEAKPVQLSDSAALLSEQHLYSAAPIGKPQA